MALKIGDGRMLVGLARSTLEEFVKSGRVPRQEAGVPLLSEKRGVFVTLNEVVASERSLRGCIGFPHPVKRLGEAVVEATVAAASEDPRFNPVQADELARIAIEVSVLTVPEALTVSDRRELPRHVRIGTDGLIVSTDFQSGLLLPQVATDFGMDQERFLSETCMKAGLLPDSWLDERTSVQRFQAEVFGESEPRGDVARVET